MGNIPGPQKERFYEKKYVVELIAMLPPLVTAAVGALVSLADAEKRTLGWWLAGATAWLAMASGIKVLHAAIQDRDRKRSRNYDGLRGSLWVLYESVRRTSGVEKPGDGTLRVTIYITESCRRAKERKRPGNWSSCCRMWVGREGRRAEGSRFGPERSAWLRATRRRSRQGARAPDTRTS